MDHPLLTCEEAATYLRLHPRTVGRLLTAGKLPGVKVGRQWRLRRADLDAYLVGQVGEPEVAGHGAAPPESPDSGGSPRGGSGAVAAR
ncbi:MAG: helix-turn-helix domain-containing protein [Chloroflexota bacterium]|nr:helix-turn-helix domain-containing protein [Chloroflexota bacterium]